MQDNIPFFDINTIKSFADIYIDVVQDTSKLLSVFHNVTTPIIFIEGNVFEEYLPMLANIFYPFILFTNNYSGMNKDIKKLLENPNLVVWYCEEKFNSNFKIQTYPIQPSHNDLHFKSPVINFHNKSLKEKKILSPADKGLISYDELIKYKFVLINNNDKSLVWKALLVGTIPVVLYSLSCDLYINLPVLIVHRWGVLTDDFLDETYDDFMKDNSLRFDKLYKYYWINEVYRKRCEVRSIQ
tara:strand:+ start:15772 stop:16494 length:723 start_codon:yes stop_codon:yes gene_type:complete